MLRVRRRTLFFSNLLVPPDGIQRTPSSDYEKVRIRHRALVGGQDRTSPDDPQSLSDKFLVGIGRHLQ